MRSVIYLSLIVLLCVFLILKSDGSGLFKIGEVDFSQYYSAATLLRTGANPYDPEKLLELQKTLLGQNTELIRMWNPPTALTFALPFTYLPFNIAAKVWLLSQLSLALIGASLFARYFKLALVLAWILTLTTLPLIDGLGWGQISALLLFGFALGFWYLKDESNKKPFYAGIALSLTLLKPHLLYLGFLYLFLWLPWKESIRLLAGILLGVVLTLAIPIILTPNLIAYYVEAIASPPIYWKTPTVGTFIQGLASDNLVFWRFVPTICGIIIISAFRAFSPKVPYSNETLLLLIPISLLTSPYGWLYDQVLLVGTLLLTLSSIMELMRHSKSSALILIVHLSLIQLFTLTQSGKEQHTFWFYPVFIFCICYVVRSCAVRLNARRI